MKMAIIESPTERTTAATDALLGVLAGAVIALLRGGADPSFKLAVWTGVLGLLALASVLGAVVHGLQMAEHVRDKLWGALFLALGLMVALFAAGVVIDMWGAGAARRALPWLLGVGVVFWAVTRVIEGSFLAFVLYEAVFMLFALGAYTLLAVRGGLPGAWWMASAVLVTIIAAGIQAAKGVRVRVIWAFDHNGVFHVVQMVGVVLLGVGLRMGL